MKTCETCEFWLAPTRKVVSSGTCRRYPPDIAKGFQPLTTKDQGCGEHKAKPVLTPARKR